MELVSSEDEKEFSAGERMYLGAEACDVTVHKDHFDRYEFAKKFLKKDFTVVDAACGTGYGSEMIAGSCGKVVGLEVSDHALAWARTHHAKANVEFKKADLNKTLDLPSGFADAVVSFETLEHIANQDMMLAEFKRILKPHGLLLISSPDRDIITGKAHLKNDFHINELSKPEFVAVMRKYFTLEDLYAQSKFHAQPWHRRAVRSVIMKADIFHLRPKIVRALGLTSAVRKNFSPLEATPIEPVDVTTPNDFFVLIAVCRNGS